MNRTMEAGSWEFNIFMSLSLIQQIKLIITLQDQQ